MWTLHSPSTLISEKGSYQAPIKRRFTSGSHNLITVQPVRHRRLSLVSCSVCSCSMTSEEQSQLWYKHLCFLKHIMCSGNRLKLWTQMPLDLTQLCAQLLGSPYREVKQAANKRHDSDGLSTEMGRPPRKGSIAKVTLSIKDRKIGTLTT